MSQHILRCSIVATLLFTIYSCSVLKNVILSNCLYKSCLWLLVLVRYLSAFLSCHFNPTSYLLHEWVKNNCYIARSVLEHFHWWPCVVRWSKFTIQYGFPACHRHMQNMLDCSRAYTLPDIARLAYSIDIHGRTLLLFWFLAVCIARILQCSNVTLQILVDRLHSFY